ncbi:glutamate 5-kinase [Roseibium limicola]|uniref:Glutamate 5-kinase n=1 Tax=Roseibium limicola TaxID=2816037 RepID=A0A939EPB1_9HYPH|nr:glutamate 5-kinase [Roseibium limicola]MBO0345557.1 glutamate 5-kinase [Roseibium limicola]
MSDTYRLGDFHRIVVKIGSALLVDEQGLKTAWLEALIADLVALADNGAEIMLVSSGSVALGRNILGLPKGPLKLEESQAAASAGQIELAKTYAAVLGRHNRKAGQILLTLGDTEERRRYLNARATVSTLLKLGAVPIINENDSVATSVIRYGDNDRLAARVATMVSADCLVLLSDIDGLYTAPPHLDPNAVFLPLVPSITPEIEAMAGSAASELSRGGMKTKIDAGKIATAAGTTMVIASGKTLNPLKALVEGARCTWFPAQASAASARKAWIGGHLEPKGELLLDDGALHALRSGKSLLPAGVVRVNGEFYRGDAVIILGGDGRIVGRGIVAYDHDDAQMIAGRNSREIEAIVGYPGRAEMVHRDDMALDDAFLAETR